MIVVMIDIIGNIHKQIEIAINTILKVHLRIDRIVDVEIETMNRNLNTYNNRQGSHSAIQGRCRSRYTSTNKSRYKSTNEFDSDEEHKQRQRARDGQRDSDRNETTNSSRDRHGSHSSRSKSRNTNKQHKSSRNESKYYWRFVIQLAMCYCKAQMTLEITNNGYTSRLNDGSHATTV